jgi:carboxymethylenebutenolidase
LESGKMPLLQLWYNCGCGFRDAMERIASMAAKNVDIRTNDGIAKCEFFSPPDADRWPAVILYMDAFGIRPALVQMAERIAAAGNFVLLPDLYYRLGSLPPFDPKTAFNDPRERERLMGIVQSLKNGMVMDDTRSFLDFLNGEPATSGRPVGCVGYCMGGPLALSAAGTFPESVRAAASIHGGRLATDQADSPHLLAPKMRAEIYVGVAGIDAHFTPEERQRLQSALTAAGVKHTIEIYPDVKHGFAVADIPVYDAAAAEHHWQQILKLFAENLPAEQH